MSLEEKPRLHNKRILFVCGASGRDDLMLSLSKELKTRHNTSSFYLTDSKGSKEYLMEKGLLKEKITPIIFDGQDKIIESDIPFIRAAEEKYGFNIWDIWQIAAPRKKSRLKIKDKQILSMMEYVIKEFEQLLSNIKPDYVILTGIASFSAVIFYRILIHQKISIIQLTNARLPSRFSINNNLEDRWPLLVKYYEEIKKRPLSESEKKFSNELIKEFKIKKFKPDDSTKMNESFSVKLKRYSYYLKVLRHRKSLPNLNQFIFFPLKEKFLRYSKRFESPVDGEKFIFFPLQIQPEASTSIMGKWYVNQLSLIDCLSKSMPCDYKLYVKEHVKNFAGRPKNFHKEIKKYPNVRLISPNTNSYNLVSKSSLVVTITGTAGWEAILLQKPVITFGNVFYNVFDEVKKVDKISDLPSLIKERLDTIVDDLKTHQFIAALDLSTFNGSTALPGDCQNRSLKADNISRIANGIEKYLDAQ